MENKNLLRDNIKKNYVYTFLSRFALTEGIWMIFLASRGLTLAQLGILEGVFHLTSLSMEIPTGAVADLLGRKTSRISGRIISVISAMILLFANSYSLYIIGFIFSAISYNLESGAGDALLYDSLKEIKEEKKYMKIAGASEVISQVSQTCAFILGGYLSNYSYTYAYIGVVIVGIISIAQAFTFVEPHIDMETDKKGFALFINQIVESGKIIGRKPKIGFLIVFSQCIFMFTTSIFYYFQNFLKHKGYTPSTIGIILALSSLASAIGAARAYKIEKKISEKGIVLVLPIFTALSIWGLALTKYYYVFFIIINAIDGIIFVAISDYINKIIPSNKRATILSLASMMFSLFMIVIFPLIGKLGDMYSLQYAFTILGIISSILVITNIIVFKISESKGK